MCQEDLGTEKGYEVLTDYLREKDPDKRLRGYAWNTAIGLQRVDGLATSEYLREVALRNIEGEISIHEAQELIASYYKQRPQKNEEGTQEADIVSSRITETLSEQAFVFSAAQYLEIHTG